MAVIVGHDRLILLETIGPSLFADRLASTINGIAVGASSERFTAGPLPTGSYRPHIACAAPYAVTVEDAPVVWPPTLPEAADPPFPPTYPYLFSTAVLYGRELMNQTLDMVRGDTYEFQANIIRNGSAVNLTGCTVWMTAKWKAEDLDAAAVFSIDSTGSDVVISDPTNGVVQITIVSAKTRTLPSRVVRLPYDIQYKDTSSKIYTPIRGILVVSPDLTIATT